MIILDTNALISFLKNSEEVKNLRELLRKAQSLEICIPTPVLAEFLAHEDNLERVQQLTRPNSKFRKLPFDEKSALLAAKIYKANKAALKQMEEPNQKVKVDLQILAIALSNRANMIITNDSGIKKIINRLNISINVYDYVENSFVQEMTKNEDIEIAPTSSQHH